LNIRERESRRSVSCAYQRYLKLYLLAALKGSLGQKTSRVTVVFTQRDVWQTLRLVHSVLRFSPPRHPPCYSQCKQGGWVPLKYIFHPLYSFASSRSFVTHEDWSHLSSEFCGYGWTSSAGAIMVGTLPPKWLASKLSL
jgi:hypothetical protein